MKSYRLLLLLGLAAAAGPPAKKATPLCRAGETNLYSFATAGGKTVSLCRGPRDGYLVYRYGTAAKIEMQYPAVLDASSWGKFTYATYLRPSMGGTNSGLDLNHLSFANGGVRYTVYADFADGEDETLGVGVKWAGGKDVFIKGRPKSGVGTLIDLRDNDRVKTSDEL